MDSIAQLRKNYTFGQLSETEVPPNPLSLFQVWFDQAVKAECPEPNSMTLATADIAGNPSARIVLLKGADEAGFTFFTNYESQKGKDLAGRPHAALLFHWHELERQVRIKGMVERVSAAESDEYFHSRPAASRIGAWASPQSAEIPNREFLEEAESVLQLILGISHQDLSIGAVIAYTLLKLSSGKADLPACMIASTINSMAHAGVLLAWRLSNSTA